MSPLGNLYYPCTNSGNEHQVNISETSKNEFLHKHFGHLSRQNLEFLSKNELVTEYDNDLKSNR